MDERTDEELGHHTRAVEINIPSTIFSLVTQDQINIEIPEEGLRRPIPAVNFHNDVMIEELPLPNDEEPIPNRPLVGIRANMRTNFLPLAIASHQARLQNDRRTIRSIEFMAIREINRNGSDLYVRGQLTLSYLWKNLKGFALGPRLMRRYHYLVSNLGYFFMVLSAFLGVSLEKPGFAYLWAVYELLANLVIFCLRRWVHRETITKFSKIELSVLVLQLIPMVRTSY